MVSVAGGYHPQVVAHRGASSDVAEHTLAAYVRAIEEGADAVECDVRLTADGHLVCVHDRTAERTAKTRRVISSMSLAELERLDFADWKNPWSDLDDEAPDPSPADRSVLTLRTLLDTLAAQPRRVEIAIETKHPTRYAGLVEKRLVDMLADYGWGGAKSPARVMSFSAAAVLRVRKLAPALRVVQLVQSPSGWAKVRSFVRPDWYVGPGVEMLRDYPEVVRKMQRQTRGLHVWTVNTAQDLDRCREFGVKAVITDHPGKTVKRLRKINAAQ